MGINERAKQDGSGPHKDSFQRAQTGNVGRRILSGQPCPARGGRNSK